MQTVPFNPSQLHHAFTLSNGKTLKYCSLPALKNIGIDSVSRLPISIRIILESLIRNTDDHRITFEHVQQLANWQPNAPRNEEIPFYGRARCSPRFHRCTSALRLSRNA